MPILEQIDLMARGGSVALLMLWSWILLRDHNSALAARVAVAMNAAIISYLLSHHNWDGQPFGPLTLFFNWASVLAAPLFWLFASVWFSDASRITRRSSGLIVAFAALALIQSINFAITGTGDPIIWLVVRIGMISFAAAGLWAAWQGRDNDLVETRRRFRSTLVWIIGLFVLWVCIMEIPHHGGLWKDGIRVVTELAIALVTGGVSAAMYRIGQNDMFATQSQDNPISEPIVIDPILAERVQHYMKTERAYRDETLSIAKLAAQLGEQEYRLRRVINGQLGHRNFSAFLNSYRLAEVKAALVDPTQTEVPIITIALDAGFGSLGPFNRAFRETEGMTPSEYRAQPA